MKTRPGSGWLAGIVVCLLLCAALTSLAEDGRDFTAMYAVSNANVGSDTVALTLTLRLFNHSGADVADATVVLEDPSQQGGSFGSITGVAVRYREDIRLSADFIISRAEYDAWQQGGQPKLHIDFTDANGNSVGAAGVVASFSLLQTMSGTVVTTVNEAVDSTTPDPNFRWDASAMQWIFNISTKPLTKNVTYFFRVTLNDGTTINFNFGLK